MSPRRNFPRDRRTAPRSVVVDSQTESLDDAARRLVETGRCSPLILDRRGQSARPTGTEETE